MDTSKYNDVRKINAPVKVTQGGVRGDDIDAGQAAAAEIASEYAYGDLKALSRGYTDDNIQPTVGSATLDTKQ